MTRPTTPDGLFLNLQPAGTQLLTRLTRYRSAITQQSLTKAVGMSSSPTLASFLSQVKNSGSNLRIIQYS